MNRKSRASLESTCIAGVASQPCPSFCPRAMAEETPTPSQLFSRAPAGHASADQVLNVMEFEALARDALPPAHFGYIATGADDDRTVVRNHDAFSDYEIRARRFNDLSTSDHRDFGVSAPSWPSPLYTSARFLDAQRFIPKPRSPWRAPRRAARRS